MKRKLSEGITKGVLSRRDFINWAIGTSILASVFTTVLTLYRNVIPPERSLEGKLKLGWTKITTIDKVPKEGVLETEFGEEPIVLLRDSEEIIALSLVCPHVACKLFWVPQRKEFDCPCHESSFSMQGKRLGGPAPRDMFTMDMKIENNDIIIGGRKSERS